MSCIPSARHNENSPPFTHIDVAPKASCKGQEPRSGVPPSPHIKACGRCAPTRGPMPSRTAPPKPHIKIWALHAPCNGPFGGICVVPPATHRDIYISLCLYALFLDSPDRTYKGLGFAITNPQVGRQVAARKRPPPPAAHIKTGFNRRRPPKTHIKGPTSGRRPHQRAKLILNQGFPGGSLTRFVSFPQSLTQSPDHSSCSPRTLA